MRHELTDRQWERLEPLLPAERSGRGRPNGDHRRIVNAVVWRLTTGAPWRDLPEVYQPWGTVYSRFRRWDEAGVWDRVLAAVQAEGDAEGLLDWGLHFVDGSVIRAHRHAAGAKKGAVIKRWGAVAVGSAPNSMSALKAVGSQSPGCSPRDTAMSNSRSRRC